MVGDCAGSRVPARASRAPAASAKRNGFTSGGLNLALVSFRAMRSSLALLSLLLVSSRAAAQTEKRIPVGSEVFAGSELESYLRVLQVRGIVPEQPWSLRPFSPPELARLAPPDSGHPWAGRYRFRSDQRGSLAPMRPGVNIVANTTFPYGHNDGAVWAGRGATLVADGGFHAQRGALSLTLDPIAFVAQNAAFRLMPNQDPTVSPYADPVYGAEIDLPQRFGNRPYAVLDPGQSTLRLDAGGVALGISTANEYWGPAREFPIILGNNAAGIPRAFVGTARPLDLSVVQLSARVIWGRLSQSAYSPDSVAGGLRFGTGAVAVLGSRYVPGLEIGACRFAHLYWPGRALSLNDFLYPLSSQNRAHLAGTERDNQLASIFFRWNPPRSGFEVYGEYGRDDFLLDRRELAEELDRDGGYTIGFQKVWGSGTRLHAIRAELHDLQPSALAQGRGVFPFYIHSPFVRQGHTERGQLLGSYAGFGGGGGIAAFETYYPGGRWTLSWTRILQRQRGAFFPDSIIDPRGLDVMHALSWNALFFRGRYDITTSATLVYEFNRDFRADYVNLNATFGVRAFWR